MRRVCSDFLSERSIKNLGNVPESFRLCLRGKEYEFNLKFFDEKKKKCKVYISRDMRAVAKFRDNERSGSLPMKDIISSANEFEKFHLGRRGQAYGFGVRGNVTMVVTSYKGVDIGTHARSCVESKCFSGLVFLTKGVVCMLLSLMDMWMYVSDNEMRNFGVVRGTSVVPLDEETYHNAMEVGYSPKRYYRKIMDTYWAYESFLRDAVVGGGGGVSLDDVSEVLSRGEAALKMRMSGRVKTVVRIEDIDLPLCNKRLSTMKFEIRPRTYLDTIGGGWVQCKGCGALTKRKNGKPLQHTK